MKRLIVILAVLSLFAASSAQAASKEVKGNKAAAAGPEINWTWGDGTASTSKSKTNVKAVKGKNIKKVKESYGTKSCDYIK
jgi:hypothetical protein